MGVFLQKRALCPAHSYRFPLGESAATAPGLPANITIRYRQELRGSSFAMNGKAVEWTLGTGDQVARRGHTTRAFRILMAGSSVSLFGSRISTIAFPMLVLHLSGSPSVAGLVVFAAIVPSMLIYMPAGAMVDRLDPKRGVHRDQGAGCRVRAVSGDAAAGGHLFLDRELPVLPQADGMA